MFDLPAHVEKRNGTDPMRFLDERVELLESGHGALAEIWCCFGGFDLFDFLSQRLDVFWPGRKVKNGVGDCHRGRMNRGHADAELHLRLNVETLALIRSTVLQVPEAHVGRSGVLVLLHMFEILLDDGLHEALHDVE